MYLSRIITAGWSCRYVTISGSVEEDNLNYITPPQVFAGAVADFLTVIGLPTDTIFTLINLAISAFALTSLDSVAQVGRLAFQELFQEPVDEDRQRHPLRRLLSDKYFATAITLLIAYFLTKAGYSAIWPLFGSANQLLSVPAFITCAVFFKRTGRAHSRLYVPIYLGYNLCFARFTTNCGDMS